MSIVQHEYASRMNRLTAKERMARSVAMFKWSRDLIARQILAANGLSNFERLKWEVAMRQYGSDAKVRLMIQRMLDRVCD